MPELAPAARAAGQRAFTTDPHNSGPDQRRYGHTKPVQFDRRRRIDFTTEANGHVATCLGCGWLTYDPDRVTVERRAKAHEKCPERKRKRK